MVSVLPSCFSALLHTMPTLPATRPSRYQLQFGGGPITLAEYMSETLTNPQHGYYTQAGGGGWWRRGGQAEGGSG